MLKIIVQNENLSYFDKLKRILEDRQSQVIVSDGSMPVDNSSVENSETCFLCSKQYLDTVNGNSGLIQVVQRVLKQTQSLLLMTEVRLFSIKEDLGENYYI